MNVYVSNIAIAAVTFPLLAAAITLPYLIYQYRKFGSVPWLRTLVVYSFVFYLLCAYFMVLLPLPADRTAVVPYAQTPQLVPFEFVRGFLAETTFSPTNPATWLDAIRDPYVYEAFFNVLLLVPLGMYLRYYFRRTWWQTLGLGFLVTLSFELTQLTGLWGIYAHPYRLFDVDDLILNTFGAMVGFWAVGPALRALPDIRLVNMEAREAGVRASVTKRALSFGIDFALASVVTGVLLGTAGSALRTWLNVSGSTWGIVVQVVEAIMLFVAFVAVPAVTKGQTLGQKLLRLRIVRPDASRARWYQFLARYGLLYLIVMAPFVALSGLLMLPVQYGTESSALATFVASHRVGVVVAWAGLMAVWLGSLVVRAFRSWRSKRPFVMLNGLMSNTRVMTCAGVERERERRAVVDVADVAALERAIADGGTSLAELMQRAGESVADTVRAWVPDPAPITVLAGAGNNGGDGWVAAHALAEAGYPVTLVTPDIAERLKAEPAHSTARAVFADAAKRNLPLTVLVAPDADVLSDTVDRAEAIVDALLGTGFAGEEVREPYAAWIEAANRRRFEGSRGKGRGQHRKRTHERGAHERTRRTLPPKAKDAPFAVAVDVPSGLNAQTGSTASPCFAADMTVTMLAFKPGLVARKAACWTGAVKLSKLVETRPYLERLGEPVPEDD